MINNQITLRYFPNARKFYHVYQIGSSKVAENPHSHNFFQICYVMSGNLIHQHGDKVVILDEGDAFIVPPILEHSIIADDPGTSFYSLSFQEPLFEPHFCYSIACKFLQALKIDNNEYPKIDIKLRVKLNKIQQLNIASLFQCLMRQSKIEEQEEESIASSVITAILTTLANAYFSQPAGQQQLAYISECQNIIYKCISYIDAHYNESLTVPFLSKKFAISVSSFGIWFPEVAGTSFKRYLNKKRIEHAKALIGIETLQLNEIATIVGYNRHSTFYRNFKKFVSLSPSDYRNQITSNK